MASTAARASERGRAERAGRDQPRRAPLRIGGQRAGTPLQRVDDRIDLPPRIAQPFLDPLVEPLLERVFAVAQLELARVQLRGALAQRLAVAGDQPALVLERLDVALDLREVLGELRFALACGAPAPAR